jgi:hypothetical protein
MKRVSIISKPTSVTDLADFDSDNYDSSLQLRAERLHVKQLRKFRHQMA